MNFADDETKKELNFINIALIYVGAIMGAGFASGREIWQFFGVFGTDGYWGILIVMLLFSLVGILSAMIAARIGSCHMGDIIVPAGNMFLSELVSRFMALMLFTVIIAMSAAGGALFNQQFGISRAAGGAVITIMVIVTVIGGFERLSGVFKKMMPVLLSAVIIVCIAVILSDMPKIGREDIEIKPAVIAGNNFLAPMVYLSYNMLAIIPIVAASAVKATNRKHVIMGGGLGGIFLGLLAFALVTAMLSDPKFSHQSDMPMLAFSSRIGPAVNFVYTLVMLFAIYASATGNFYGFTTKIREDKYKKLKIVLSAIIGFLFGLLGFREVVAYMLPVEGYLGFAILLMLFINFYKVVIKGQHRLDYPKGIHRVTGGEGGTVTLIVGSSKSAVVDCGMAYCGDKTVDNIKCILGEKPLDYVFATHSHYDHIGGLGHIRKAYPDVKVLGSSHADSVFKRKNALSLIKKLGLTAGEIYSEEQKIKDKIIMQGIEIDNILKDGDRISLGDKTVLALETRGHTNCSMSFFVEEDRLLFASESTGVPSLNGGLYTSILKSYEDSMKSLEKCRGINADQVIFPHYGIIKGKKLEKYWEEYLKCAIKEKKLIESMIKRDLSDKNILKELTAVFWNENRAKSQPYEAFEINAMCTIKMFRENYNKK